MITYCGDLLSSSRKSLYILSVKLSKILCIVVYISLGIFSFAYKYYENAKNFNNCIV